MGMELFNNEVTILKYQSKVNAAGRSFILTSGNLVDLSRKK